MQRQKVPVVDNKTCHEETSGVKSQVHDFLVNMNHKMEHMADGINKMGDAWQSLARPRRNTVTHIPQIPTETARAERDMYRHAVSCDLKDDMVLQRTNRQQTIIRNEAQSSSVDKKSETPFFNYTAMCPKKDIDEEKTGPNTHKELAHIANDAFSDAISYEQIKEIQEKYTRPKNCDKMVVPRVNKEIWRSMQPPYIKTRDQGIMRIQGNLTKASSAIIKATEFVLKNRNEAQEDALRACTDAICMLGNANTSLSIMRRRQLGPILGNQSKTLCNKNVPINSLLFGDDLSAMGFQSIRPDKRTRHVKRPRDYRQSRPRNRRRDPFHLEEEPDDRSAIQFSPHHGDHHFHTRDDHTQYMHSP